MSEQLPNAAEINHLRLAGELLEPPSTVSGFEGPVAVYNPSAIVTLNGDKLVWARVEPDTPDIVGKTDIRLFSLDEKQLIEIPINTRLKGEDPSFTKIGDRYLLGVVEVEVDETTGRTIPTTVFYEYDPIRRKCTERLRGPVGQKDVRIAPVDPDHPEQGLAIYGRRDSGENDERLITFTAIIGFDDPLLAEKLAFLDTEEAIIGRELFEPVTDSNGVQHRAWGGVNQVMSSRSASGQNYRLLAAHRAHYMDDDLSSVEENRPRYYEGMLLLDLDGELVEVCTLGRWDDFTEAAVHKGGRPDLAQVCFMGGAEDGKLSEYWLFGIGDCRIGIARIDSEQMRLIEQTIDGLTQAHEYVRALRRELVPA